MRLNEALTRIIEARHHDPFEVLGRHGLKHETLIRVFLPNAESVTVAGLELPLSRIKGTDLFEWHGDGEQIPDRYQIRWTDPQGAQHCHYDPYCFPPQIGDLDLHLFGEGRHRHTYRFLGAHRTEADGITGTQLAVWAPNAERVSVIGNFNQWDGRTHPMRVRGSSGIWELFIPELESGQLYKFEIRSQSGEVSGRCDPYGNYFQQRPDTAGIILSDSEYVWTDETWLDQRREEKWQEQPMSIYEVHLGSWQRDESGHFLNYREMAGRLATYVADLGFTHIELLPITEHPLDASWGYQTTGYFAPTSRFGTPDDFRYFINHLHQAGIGVILDWVPAHFPKDRHALARFDGSALYEHEDPRLGEHRDWGTLIFNFGRKEVCNFLLSSAVYWLEEFHIDGLRVDAVASMLYLDYSREADDWIPNIHGGRENLEAVAFLQHMNEVTHDEHPGTVTIAEESTAWPQVSRPTWLGGLGFSMKWNMGWMHDSLSYMAKDPVYRHYHHDLLTFGLLYAFTENFVLPFSHDEVVHGKGSMLNKMQGDRWQKFANLRLLYSFMFAYPGKKLLFMGSEFAQEAEWDENCALAWQLLEQPDHQGITTLIRDLNRLYKNTPALHGNDFGEAGFEWIDCHDSAQSVLSFLRQDHHGNIAITIVNFTPVPRYNYRIGLPAGGYYHEILNSDSSFYGGSDVGNEGGICAEEKPWMGRGYSCTLDLPPLGAIILAAN